MSATRLRAWLLDSVLRRRFIQDVGVLAVANVAAAVLGLVQAVLVARWLGPELFGVTALIISYPSLLYAVLDPKSKTVTVRYLSEFNARRERDRILALCRFGYCLDLGIASVTVVAALSTAGWAAGRVAHHPQGVGLIAIYAVALVPSALTNTSRAVLTVLQRFATIAWIEGTTTIVRVALVLWLVGSGWGVAGVVWGNAIGMALGGVTYGLVAHALIQRTWGRSWLRAPWRPLLGRYREIARFLVYNDIHTTAGFVGRQLDVLLIGYFRGATEVGYYKLARNLAGATGYAVGPLTTVAYADLTRHWSAGEVARFWHKVRRLAWQVGLPLGLAIGLGVLVLPEILTLLVGPAYTPAITVARILLAASACEAAFFWVHLTYMATGHIGTFLSISGSFTVVLGLTWLVVVPLFGYVGMAAAVLAVGAAQTAVSVALLPRLGARDELQGVIGRNGESATSVMS